MSGGIAIIDRDRLVKEIQERHYRGRVGDKVEGVVALRVLDIWIGAMGYEQLNDVQIAITSRPLHGSSDEIAAKGINFSALFEEVATCGELRIDGCPMEGSDVLAIAVRSPRATRLYELPDEVDVATLGGQKNVWLLMRTLSDGGENDGLVMYSTSSVEACPTLRTAGEADESTAEMVVVLSAEGDWSDLSEAMEALGESGRSEGRGCVFVAHR